MFYSFFSHRFCLATIALILLIVPARAQDNANESELKAVPIRQSPVYKSYVTTARVMPLESSVISAPRDGRVTQVNVSPGMRVEPGMVLAVMDSQDLQEKKTRLDKEYSELSAHLKRVEKLVERDLMSAKIWDKNVGKLSKLGAERKVIEEKIDNSTIRAETNGVVLWSDAQTGENIKGAQDLFQIGDAYRVRLEANVSPDILHGLADQKIVAVTDPENPARPAVQGEVTFTGAGGPQGEEEANLYITATRTAYMKTGKDMKIMIAAPGETWSLIVPESAVREDQYIWWLQPLQVEPHRYKLSRRAVDVTARKDGLAYFQDKEMPTGTLILTNPGSDMDYGQIVSVYQVDGDWGSELAGAVLNEYRASQQATTNGAASSCGAAGGGDISALGQNIDEDERVCLVPAKMFEDMNNIEVANPFWERGGPQSQPAGDNAEGSETE